jgi:hypothetical protein
MSNQYLLNRLAGRDPNVRAGDEDRERIAERLRTGHAEGRLELGEFQERLERCYQAKTFGELGELVRDLPRQDEPDQGRLTRRGRWRVVPLVPILLALVLVSAATGHHHVFWLWIPLLFLIWRMSWWRRRRWLAGARRGPGGWI